MKELNMMNLRWNYENSCKCSFWNIKVDGACYPYHKLAGGHIQIIIQKITMIKSIDHSEKLKVRLVWKEHEATLMCGFKVSQNHCYKKEFQAKVWHHIAELRNNPRHKSLRTSTPQQQAPHSITSNFTSTTYPFTSC
jgi:hypothetical protein